MADISCKIDIAGNAEEATQLTVGHVFYLICHGSWPSLDPATLEMRVNPEDQYKLKLLGFEKINSNQAQLKVTSYVVGQHQLQAVQVVDKDQSVVLGNIDLNVTSVINPQEPPQEPFGPVGPLSLAIPLLWFVVVGAIIAFIAGIFGIYIYRKQQRRKLLQALSDQYIGTTAYHQFHKHLRQLQRSHPAFAQGETTSESLFEAIKALAREYRGYLGVRLQVPAHRWGSKQVLKDLKRNQKDLMKKHEGMLKKTYQELERSLNAKDKLQSRDLLQLAEQTRKTVDTLEAEGGKAK